MNKSSRLYLILLFAFSGLSLISCQTVNPPVEEWALARAAVEAAKTVQAAKYSPGFWHQAEESYRRGRALFKEESYKDARMEFLAAKRAAEKAENSARIKRQQSGEVL
jgi:Domain of unknown function (DUF4398)